VSEYPKTMTRLLFLAVFAAGARAEFLEMRVFVKDMNCESCTQNLEATFKRMRSVESVDVDFKAGTIALKLAEKNRLSPEQVWDAIKRVGFTPGATEVRVRGSINNGKLEVAEAAKTYEIEGKTSGENVELTGKTMPPADPRTPVRIKVGD